MVEAPRAVAKIHYLSVLAVVVLGTRWAQYLWPTEPTFRGQSVAIWFMYAGMLVVLITWLWSPARSRARGLLASFLAVSLLLWIALIVITRIHGDLFNYTAFWLPAILLMVWWKAPSSGEAWTAIRVAGWSMVVMLLVTRVLEMVGLLAVRDVPDWIDRFDRARYWLPLSDLMGIDGRWPGPFGHNGHTAMAGALLIVIAVAQWCRISSPVFIFVGIFTLLLINGRASIGAAVVGIGVMIVFSRRGVLGSIPGWVRVAGALAGVALAAFVLYRGEAGMTGRNAIWPAFFDLWTTSPVIGVGTTGINSSSGLTLEFGHAHNLYLDELTRHGLVGLLLMLTMLAIGAVIAFRSAVAGSAGPLAIIASYLVLALTEPRNDWIHPSVAGLLLLLSVLAASGVSAQRSHRSLPQDVQSRIHD